MDQNFRLCRNVPNLRRAYLEEIKRLEALRRQFVRDYSLRRLAALALRNFVIGRGDATTFCYRVERELDGLGRILGAPATKFGIYFSQKDGRYRHTSIWGASPETAFVALKSAILELLEAASRNDVGAINRSRLSPMFKGKLLHLYFPENFAPIFSPEHLEHFVACLNLTGNWQTSVERQQALMEFRRTHPLLRDEPIGLFMRALYLEFPLDDDDTGENGDGDQASKIPVSVAANALKELSALPIGTGTESDINPPKPGKYDPTNGRRKYIGDRGETLVIEYEKRRLQKSARPELAKRIKHVAAEDDSKGYDILSFDQDGTPRQIEVKSTSGKNLSLGFYLTANERRSAAESANYHIYFVFEALGAAPSLFILTNPQIDQPKFQLRPTEYHVTICGDGYCETN